MVFDINIYDADGNLYELKDGDKVEFTVKSLESLNNNPYKLISTKPVIQKTGTSIKLINEDTQHLPFGAYVYDVQITFTNGDRDTIIAPQSQCDGIVPNFYLTEEVNFK